MKIANKTTSAVRLVTDALEKANHFKDRNIFTSLSPEYALKKAKDIDRRIALSEPVGPLAGVPFVIKDNFLHPIGPTTASSKYLSQFHAPFSATVVRLLEQSDAVLIGRTNLDSFAHGSSTENSYFGPSKNAINPDFIPGGSSGGSAVAVALDIVPFATGSDTGGSIRQPASMNGTFGLKPSYGALSRYGIVPMASSTDCPGFLAKTAKDLEILLSTTSRLDPLDSTSSPVDKIKTAKSQYKIAILKDLPKSSINPEVLKIYEDTIKKLQTNHEIIEVDFPSMPYSLAVYHAICSSEIASNLARFDGVRFGHRSVDSDTIEELYKNSRQEGFMPENIRRILLGTILTSANYYEKYYEKAAKVRTLIINDYKTIFSQADFLLTPVSPNPPFRFGEKTSDPVAMYLEDIFSTPASLAGLPALAFPAGEISSKLPVGLQLTGSFKSDFNLIEFVKEYLS